VKKFISYPSIHQFRNVVKQISLHAAYIGKDENDNPIYDGTLPKPIVTFTGTVKIHGTNSSVCFNAKEGLWTQSRSRIITPENDNAGFAAFVYSKQLAFLNFIGDIQESHQIDLDRNTISIYGEWCGKGIQKGVAINELLKMFVVFGAKITPHNEEESAYWIDISNIVAEDEKDKIYNIYQFPIYKIDIDFNDPKASQNKIIDMTLEVEAECPVAKAFGVSGIGEGIVFSSNYKGNNYRFKSKGEKHTTSKVKKLSKVDNEKVAKINELVNIIVRPFRLEQGIQETFNTLNGGEIDRKSLGNFIKWVVNDTIKEELDLIVEAELEPKEVSKSISILARNYFFKLEKEN